MPTWSSELPSVSKHMGFDLRRTPESGCLQAVITCENILVCDTHFFHGRTSPCERPDCPACNESIPYRTHCYVSAYEHKTREHFIFECTAHAAKPFAEQYQDAGTLRGCIFNATRPKGLKNSKVCILINTTFKSNSSLPEPPNVILALSVIWRLPLTGLAIEHQRFRSPEIRTVREPLSAMRNQPDNMPDPPTMAEILAGNGEIKKKLVL